MSDAIPNLDDEPITLVFRRWPGPPCVETALDESEQDTLVFRRWPGPPRVEIALDESEQDTQVLCRKEPCRSSSRSERIGDQHVPEEFAMLSGSLFDGLPRVDVPLDTFFPAEYIGSAAWHRVRSDSLSPVARTPSEVPQARRPSSGWFVAMAAAVVIGMMAFSLAQGPATPSLTAQPAASPRSTTAAPAAIEEPATLASSAPTEASRPAAETGRSPVKAARPVSAAPVATNSTPAPSAAVQPTDPVIENMPIAPPAPPPPPEVPAQPTTAIAVASAARGAASCLSPGELRRTMAVSVTFAPSGRATRAVIEGGPHRATLVGSCIAQHLRGATVKPFEGPAITVHTSVHIR